MATKKIERSKEGAPLNDFTTKITFIDVDEEVKVATCYSVEYLPNFVKVFNGPGMKKTVRWVIPNHRILFISEEL